MLNRKILGIKKLDLNYGKTYIEHQQKGLSSIQGILSTSKALNQTDDAKRQHTTNQLVMNLKPKLHNTRQILQEKQMQQQKQEKSI